MVYKNNHWNFFPHFLSYMSFDFSLHAEQLKDGWGLVLFFCLWGFFFWFGFVKTKILTIQDFGIKINFKKFAANNTVWICLLIFQKQKEKKKKKQQSPPVPNLWLPQESKSFLNNLLLAILWKVQAEHQNPWTARNIQHRPDLVSFLRSWTKPGKMWSITTVVGCSRKSPPPVLQAPHYLHSSCLLYRDIMKFHSDTWGNTRNKPSPGLQWVMQHEGIINAVQVITTIYRL